MPPSELIASFSPPPFSAVFGFFPKLLSSAVISPSRVQSSGWTHSHSAPVTSFTFISYPGPQAPPLSLNRDSADMPPPPFPLFSSSICLIISSYALLFPFLFNPASASLGDASTSATESTEATVNRLAASSKESSSLSPSFRFIADNAENTRAGRLVVAPKASSSSSSSLVAIEVLLRPINLCEKVVVVVVVVLIIVSPIAIF
mmetsp:Transcript_6069/g.17836  ORF Transcript_6069/g.17836 Transcript_6069/m.17836 type:complete len:203 (+) Transcript_6069:2517-3125(+)